MKRQNREWCRVWNPGAKKTAEQLRASAQDFFAMRSPGAAIVVRRGADSEIAFHNDDGDPGKLAVTFKAAFDRGAQPTKLRVTCRSAKSHQRRH